MGGKEEEHEGASIQERLVEACRTDNTELLDELLDGKSDEEIGRLLNNTTTVMGNHLYHEAASRGNYDIIDMLLDQPSFECDPVNRQEGDTPLHAAIRWINGEPVAQQEFGNALVDMMLEAGSSTRVKNRGGLTPLQLVDPRNQALRELIQKHEYTVLSAGDFIAQDTVVVLPGGEPTPTGRERDDDEDDGEFSGSDEEERAEWERRQKAKDDKGMIQGGAARLS